MEYVQSVFRMLQTLHPRKQVLLPEYRPIIPYMHQYNPVSVSLAVEYNWCQMHIPHDRYNVCQTPVEDHSAFQLSLTDR